MGQAITKMAKKMQVGIDGIQTNKGYSVCRETYTFLHGMSKHKVYSLKNHFSDNGLTPRTHENSTKCPQNYSLEPFCTFSTLFRITLSNMPSYYQDVSLGSNGMMSKCYHRQKKEKCCLRLTDFARQVVH